METNSKLEMSKQVCELAKFFHGKEKTARVKKYLALSQEDLVKKLIIEMDAKNLAYYFILEKGYLDSFAEYCYLNSSLTQN